VAEGKPERELEAAERDGRFEDEGWRLRRDGSRFWASVVITALRDRQGTLRGFGKVTRDLTARKEAEEARRELAAREAAEVERRRADQVQERLVAIVGHDLRTPLSVITMGVGAIRQRGGLGPEQLATLERIARSGQRMQGIIDDLLDFGRSTQGRGIPVVMEDADLAEVCRRAVGELGQLNGGRAIGLSVRGDTRLHGDAARLVQVVSNLVGNALQHGDGAVQVEVEGSQDQVALSVHNHGAPIPTEELPRLFEPFRQGEGPGAGERSGSVGLGLFIVREVVRAHRGEVEVRSDAPAGTTFTVRLPRGASMPR
jgi:signal transduction histidine kinase